MTNYILVHGAWEGAWAWENITPELEKRGHSVATVALPGSLENPRPISEVTLESYISTVQAAVNEVQGVVVLVGHSLGGAVISQLAERIPERIERLVYVASFLLDDGGTILESMQSDRDAQFLPKIQISEDQSYATVSEELWRSAAFHDAQESAADGAVSRVAERQALEPFVTKLKLSKERYGSIAKQYIHTTQDRMVSPYLQEIMVKRWPIERTDTLDSGHFPALSVPREVADLLLAPQRVHVPLAPTLSTNVPQQTH